jgi:dTDP-glucose 4,6-dehydratase
MNLLITGGAGFIGSHYVLRHIERFPDDTVIVLDKMTYAADKTFLDPVISRIRFIEGDIADIELVSRLVLTYGIEAIVNFAAETHVDRSIQNAVPFIHTNIIGIQSLIEVCRASPQLQLLHVSTDEVYGDQRDDEPARKEHDPLQPSSPYAASKASGDLLILSAIRTFGINARITRCTNNYGPHQADEKYMPTIIRHALKNEPIPVYGEGKNRRDWLYVTDHCDAIDQVLHLEKSAIPKREHHVSADYIFNISPDEERQNIDVAKLILQLLGKPESLISFVPDRPGHDWRYKVDGSKMRALGWKPRVSFEEGLKKTVEWYKKKGWG